MSKTIKELLLGIKIKEVKGNFNCSHNELTSLEGSPEIVGVDFDCAYNDLTSLEGSPKIVKGDFYCNNNKVKFTRDDVRKVCNVKGYIHV